MSSASSAAPPGTSAGSSQKSVQTQPPPKPSQPEKAPVTAPAPDPSPEPKQSVTVVSVVEATDSFVALEPAPTDSPPTNSPSPSQQQQPTEAPPSPPSSTSTPSKTKAKSAAATSQKSTLIPVSTRSETTLATSIQSSSTLSSISSVSTSSSTPSLVPLGNPFQSSTDSTHHGKNKSGPTIAGVVGGLSAAILLGVLGFFLWKWKTRGNYRSNKRQSFGPYGNGIDANRGGLLVSSVACKPGDSISNHEDSLYSDENSPTRYDRPSFDGNKVREPTLPKIGDDRSFMPSSPPKTATFGMDQAVSTSYPGHPSYRPGDSMMAMAGAGALVGGAGAMAAAHHRSPVRSHGGGVLYEPRRPPVPPSMRRNRSPPQPPGAGGYEAGDYLNQGIPRSNSMGNQSMYNRPNMSNGYGIPPASLIPGRMPPMRQIQRSASMNSHSGSPAPRYSPNASPFDPLSMHPVIPEVPSGPPTPLPKEVPTNLSHSNNITKSPAQMHRTPKAATTESPSGSPVTGLTAPPRPPLQTWNTNSSETDKNKVLIIRNPSPDSDKEEKKKGGGSPIGSIVRRVSNLAKEKEHTVKPSDAAKNF